MKKFIPVLFALLLSACGPATTNLLDPDALYPEIMTSCQDEPVVTGRADKTKPRPDDVKTQYTGDLRGAWADCHDKVGEWKVRKDKYRDQYQKATEGYFQRLWGSLTGND